MKKDYRFYWEVIQNDLPKLKETLIDLHAELDKRLQNQS